MELKRIRIHNFRSIIDSDIDVRDFTMLVGANNAGKSNFMNALRCFYGDLRWNENDFPKKGYSDQESWIELSFELSADEWHALDATYKGNVDNHSLVLKRYFMGDKAKAKQNNIYAIVNGIEQDDIFYNVRSVIPSKRGKIIYIPALTTPDEQMKTSGPSPLRDLLNAMLSSFIPNSPAYTQLKQAFEQLDKEANLESGFLSTIAQPINDALSQWDVQINLSVNPISPEVITKSLISYSFADKRLDDTSFGLERFGHGFQRSVIFELIRLASSLQEEKTSRKDEFDPNFTLLLFEEPEAFLHPAQQENMAFHLRELGKKSGWQVIITSHSAVFVSKSSDNLSQICRIQKCDAVSQIYQLKDVDTLIRAGGDFIDALRRYVEKADIDERKKEAARNLINHAPSDKEIANQYEKFRYQLWMDAERASMFFADKVLLVEGATERMLFNYLLANKWHDLTRERILVVDALGKYNFHRFIRLFEAYGIQHGIILDNDHNKNANAVINQLIRDRKTKFTLANPFEFDNCLETYLGLPEPSSNKPLHILQALESGTITQKQIDRLREIFCTVLNIQPNNAQFCTNSSSSTTK